jgi:hypothetical protein
LKYSYIRIIIIKTYVKERTNWMKKRIILLILAFALVFSLASCGGDTECTEHTDANTDGKCDTCGAEVEIPGGDDKTPGGDDKTAYTVTLKDANN